MASNKKRKQTPKRPRKSNRRLYYILLSILAGGTIIVLSLTVFFKIENVTVVGNDFYQDADIINSTDIELDTNLFLTATKELPDKISKEFPYIEKVYINKKLPSTIEIVVTPSKVAAILEIIEGEDYAIISETGKVLEKGVPLLLPEIILVKGLDIKGKQPGEYLGSYEKEKIDKNNDSESLQEMKTQNNIALEEQSVLETDFMRAIEYLQIAREETGFNKITNLDVSNPLNMKVNYENRITLELGTEIALEYKLRYIAYALAAKNSENTELVLAPDARGTLSVQNVLVKNEAIFTPEEDYLLEKQKKESQLLEDGEEPIGEGTEKPKEITIVDDTN